MRDAEKTVGNMIDKLKTAFIGSIDSEGFPNIKAMLQPRKREGIKTVYLTTNTSSMRVAQYRENNHACIYFCDTRFFRGVMLRGTMDVLTDSASKEMMNGISCFTISCIFGIKDMTIEPNTALNILSLVLK